MSRQEQIILKWHRLKVCFRKGVISNAWFFADGIYRADSKAVVLAEAPVGLQRGAGEALRLEEEPSEVILSLRPTCCETKAWTERGFPALLLASVARSCLSTWALTTDPLWPCCTLGCSRSPRQLPGWQPGQGKLESLEVPFWGQLVFKIHVKPLWNCTHRAGACLVIVNMQWMKAGPGETNFKHSMMEQGQDLS